MRLVGEAADGLEAIQQARELHPDLILLDIGLPKLNGIEAAKRIRGVVPGTKILFLTSNNAADVVDAALKAGGEGYLLKTDARCELLPAIEAVARAKHYVSKGLIDFAPGLAAD